MPYINDLSTWTEWYSLSNPYLVGNDNSGDFCSTYKFQAYKLVDAYLAEHMGTLSSSIRNLDSHISWLLFNDKDFATETEPPLIDAYLSDHLSGYLSFNAWSSAENPLSSNLSDCYLPLYYEGTLYKCQVSDISSGGGDFAQNMEAYLSSLTSSPFIQDDSCCFLATSREGEHPSRMQISDYINRFFLRERSTISPLSGSDRIYVGHHYLDNSFIGQITIDQLISYINTHS